MEIKSQFEYNGKTFNAHWVEDEPTHGLVSGGRVGGVHTICFYRDKIVIVYDEKKNRWTPPGGGIEIGETYQEAVIREVREETNMNVVYQHYIGYQDVSDESGKRFERQARVFCIVEPFGDFVSDPDGDITKIKLIDPKDYKEYFYSGEIWDRLMVLTMEMKNKYDNR